MFKKTAPHRPRYADRENSERLRQVGETYSYGWPAGGTSEPNVVAQWLFDEASGNIADEVAAIAGTSAGTLTYNVAAGGVWGKLSPGITSGGGYFSVAQTVTLDLDLDDAVFEWVAAIESAGGSSLHHFFDFATGTNSRGMKSYYDSTGDDLYLILKGESDTQATMSFLNIGNFNDDTIHKWRISVDRSGNGELFVDGVSKGTSAASALALENVKHYAGKILRHNSQASWYVDGTAYELRITIGNATNNSGGPGGG